MRPSRLLGLIPLLLLATGCPGNAPTDGGDADAATDGGPDGPPGCTETTAIHSFNPTVLFVSTGMTQRVQLRLARDSSCGVDFNVRVEDATIATAPASIHIDRQHGIAEITVTGVSVGHTRLQVQQVGSTATSAQSALDINVVGATVPACPTATAPFTGSLAAGVTLHGAAGSPLELASVAVAATATTTTPLDVTIACAADQVPTGFDAAGPAVAFTPGLYRYPREIPITIPVNPGLVPSYYQLHVEISYLGPFATTPRIVSMANVRFTPDGRALYFEAPRLGTYQAVLRHGIGTRHVTHHFTYRAMLGISMGALGTSMMGMRHPDSFDFLMPIGGPADWGWFGDYFRRWHMGGFCTAAERAAGTMDCSHGSNTRTPEPEDYATVTQNFEYLNYPDGVMNQSNFDRASYMTIYRDLTHMFGNPLMQADPANGILPLGVPATELTRTTADRCATSVTLQHYCDDEFNPDGSIPVITFCDGANTAAHGGEWDPTGVNDEPVDMALAVDINRNGRRDPGEPIIRNLFEPWRDVGVDGIDSAHEPGYNALTNPDPNHDDYDRQYNPGGTERNFLHENAEPYDDVGLDGVANSASHGCTFDVGEGNGQFDTSPGVNSFYHYNGRAALAALPHDQIHRLRIWADGGMRDIFNFGASTANFVSAIAQQGENLHLYNNFSPLQTGPMFDHNSDASYVWSSVDWAHVPDYAALRYGFWDVSMEQYIQGDGGHVGTPQQVQDRAFTAIAWAASRWTDTDHRIYAFSGSSDNAGMCANGDTCTFNFHSPNANRDGPVVVVLPPGYRRSENATQTYPVIFFLHGYGMDPQNFSSLGLLIALQMGNGMLADWQRPGKFIMVFADGRCREGDGCPKGSFYVDSPNPGNVHMETYFMDLYDFIGRQFRARAPADVEITE